jgi:hypothetical protein
MDKKDSIGDLLEHVEILARNISELKISENLSIATKESALASLICINEIRDKVLSYKKTAVTLRSALENSV